jgi:hypothetical protein
MEPDFVRQSMCFLHQLVLPDPGSPTTSSVAKGLMPRQLPKYAPWCCPRGQLAHGFAFHKLIGIIQLVEPYVNPVTLKSYHCHPVCNQFVRDVDASRARHS